MRVLLEAFNTSGESKLLFIVFCHSIESIEVFKNKFFFSKSLVMSWIKSLYQDLNERCSGPPTNYKKKHIFNIIYYQVIYI